MKFSVVIPTYNRRDLLERTLPAVLNQDFTADEYEVIVVVDGSTDGTADYLAGLNPCCGYRVIEQQNLGQATARNVGWKAAAADLVLFLDDDDLCDRNLLREHYIGHSNSEGLIVFGPIWLAPGARRSVAADWYFQRSQAEYERLARERTVKGPDQYYVGPNCSVPRSALAASGGFDERLRRQEDSELGRQFWKLGMGARYQPGAVVHQLYVKTDQQVLNDAEKQGVAEVLLCRKHPEYRPHSAPAVAAGMSFPKRVFIEFARRFPKPAEHLLRVLGWSMDRLPSLLGRKGAGIEMLTKRYFVACACSVLNAVGSWQALRQEFGRKLPVLLYHHVGPKRPGVTASLTISPERFEAQVQRLARSGYTAIRASDWLHWRCEGRHLPAKPVLLTFDDAYADIAQFALPVLQRYGFTAVVFVVTSQIGGTNTWDETRGRATLRLMTPEQIRYWSAQGIEFGAHSRTHRDLRSLGPSELEQEVAGSKNDLEELIGTPVTSFAYPYGLHNRDVVECVREHFQIGFGITDGANVLRTDEHILRRNLITQGDSWIRFQAVVRWGWPVQTILHPIQRLRAAIRLRTRLRGALRLVSS
ncbi:MAG: polysaccharide deacetylase family protein [Acidobacteria bacterium]|nr:polysaccharide deacetylase family protein [Acidobacteriota bacterium]